MKNLQLFSFIIVFYSTTLAQTSKKITSFSRKSPIAFEVELSPGDKRDSVTLQFMTVAAANQLRKWIPVTNEVKDGSATWIINTDGLAYFSVKSVTGNENLDNILVEPGDDIKMTFDGKRWLYSGKGAAKVRLQEQIDSLISAIPKPENPKDYVTYSLNDYLDWHNYLNKHIEVVVPVIDSYRNEISEYARNYIKADFINQNIDDRSDKFGSLAWGYAKRNGITRESICAIYDSTYRPATEKWFRFASAYEYSSWKPVLFAVERTYLFDHNNEALNSVLKRKLLYYNLGIKTYTGLVREKFIVDQLTRSFIQEAGFIPETEKLLSEYYAEPGYAECKQYVKEFEITRRDALNGRNAADFSLTDVNDQNFKKENISGKIAVMDFWFTGCTGCVQMTPALRKVEEAFKNDTNVVFLNVSIDKDKSQWLKSVNQKKYTTGHGINLYTGGLGSAHSIIKQYAIFGYPAIFIMDPYGRLINIYPKPDPRRDNGKNIIEIIRSQLKYMKDGPYVIHNDTGSVIYNFNGTHLSTQKLERNKNDYLPVKTDAKEFFPVSIKKTVPAEQPSVFGKTNKLFVLSDIEGNFDAFKKILLANKIIDSSFNWIFGNGHLVFAGDMFDRGNQVTECLWLIYSLEEKAQNAGGYVHFIMGNHEVMNLQGNHKYAQQKYKSNSGLLGKTIKQLYGENSELGKWLRSKNIMEKIGNLLFVHGGIGNEFTDSISLSIKDVNATFRKYLDSSSLSTVKEVNTRLIFSTDYSPFWFRLYYGKEDEKLWLMNDHSVRWTIQHPTSKQLDKILTKWEVDRIVTGHTIVADTISVYYDGKVINTDTKHSEGKSEALLVEDNKYYRVNSEGARTLLFFEDKR